MFGGCRLLFVVRVGGLWRFEVLLDLRQSLAVVQVYGVVPVLQHVLEPVRMVPSQPVREPDASLVRRILAKLVVARAQQYAVHRIIP